MMQRKTIGFLAVILIFCMASSAYAAGAPDEVYQGIPPEIDIMSFYAGEDSPTFVQGYRVGRQTYFLMQHGSEYRVHTMDLADRTIAQSNPLPTVFGVAPRINGDMEDRFYLEYIDHEKIVGNSENHEYITLTFELVGEPYNNRSWKLIDIHHSQHHGGSSKTTSVFVEPYFHRMEMIITAGDLYQSDYYYGDVVIELNAINMDKVLAILDSPRENLVSEQGIFFVSNPNPNDRLNLRAKPDANSESLGKYYNGTPVDILEDLNDTWAKVSIYGHEGYMIKKYIATGMQVHDIAFIDVVRSIVDAAPAGGVPFYEQPAKGSAVRTYITESDPMLLLGTIGDDWCHVLLVDGTPGFIESHLLSSGNG